MKKIGCRDEYFYDGSHYISKNAYYRGASFLVYPSWEEVNRNILVPGDRWHPFCPPSMPPWEIILTDGNGIIPHKMIPFTLQTLEDYHPILGKKILLMNMQEHLGSDCSRLSLPVLAMGEFYERYDFQVGDALRIKVLDYDSGFYHMEHIRRPEREELDHKSDLWLNLMEKSMERVINLFGERLILPNQVDWAYFMGGPGLMRKPTLNFHHFMKRTEQFTLSSADGLYFLRKKC
ncbi:MAG: hypothetical protein JXA95_00905 [Spirochaetales bacterium]|nr:hypothetical protein [Spirochaetales bacterium]